MEFNLYKGLEHMSIFQAFGVELNYEDILQLDAAFSVAHINYGESPRFNGIDGKDISKASRKSSLSSVEYVEDVLENLHDFNGTEKNIEEADLIALWKNYWLEYINAFDKLTIILPKSVVTAYIGRQAIELGFKFILLNKENKCIENDLKTHDLKKLADMLREHSLFDETYMKGIPDFCGEYCKMIEGDNAEYFRYPEYGKNAYFAGNQLDIEWLSYNFALIILKLLHFSKLDDYVL